MEDKDNLVILSYVDLHEKYPNALKKGIQGFECSREPELKMFLVKLAEDFERKLNCRTFLIVNKDTFNEDSLDIVAFFSISLTSIELKKFNLSNKATKKLKGKIPHGEELNSLPSYAIVQLGRADGYTKDYCSGKYILDACFEYIGNAQKYVGTSLVAVECKKVLYDSFYSKFNFKELNGQTVGKQPTEWAYQHWLSSDNQIPDESNLNLKDSIVEG